MSAGARLRSREVAGRAAAGAVPGALPPDGEGLARDLSACEACGRVLLLAPGSLLCPACEAQGQAVATLRPCAREAASPAPLSPRPFRPATIVRPTREQAAAVADYLVSTGRGFRQGEQDLARSGSPFNGIRGLRQSAALASAAEGACQEPSAARRGAPGAASCAATSRRAPGCP